MKEQASTVEPVLAEIERLTSQYAGLRAAIYEGVMELELEIARLKRAALPQIKADVNRAVEARDRLREAIAAAAEYFTRPRTRVFHGIRVGIQQSPPKVEIDDEAAVIARIRERLPKDQAELLIRVKESVHKPAVADLSDQDLRRLGIRVTGGDDQVVIKPQDGEVAKMVDALLAAGDELEEV